MTDAPTLLGIDRAKRPTERVPCSLFYLDEHELPPASDDEIELVAAGADVRVENAVAAKPVVTRGESLSSVHAAALAYARALNDLRCWVHGPYARTAAVWLGVM